MCLIDLYSRYHYFNIGAENSILVFVGQFQIKSAYFILVLGLKYFSFIFFIIKPTFSQKILYLNLKQVLQAVF